MTDQQLAGYVPISAELLADSFSGRDSFAEVVARQFEPWRFPDQPRWPAFVALPVLQRVQDRYRLTRQRIQTARDALAGLHDNCGDDW